MKQARKRSTCGARPGRRRWWRLLWLLPLLFVVVTTLQVAALRFVDPPFSAFMVARQVDAWGERDWGYRTAYDWRDLDAMAPSLPLALVAAEDQNFPTHHGFDFAAIEKAQVHNQRMAARAEKRGRPVRGIRGASTISQQTAKNLFLWQGNGATRWLRKGLEVWYTALIETMWPKQRILEVYANIAEFGDGVYGAQAAARTFFGRDAAKLSPTQCARLAAVLPSPRRYDARNPGPYVQRRTGRIERQMRHLGGPGYLNALD
jgi:monofunctional biosynthetic peptidoglycan transglycosylase